MTEQGQVAAPAPRWTAWQQAIVATIGTFIAVGGLLIVVGKELGRIDTLERDMKIVQANQATYIPVLVGMQTDIRYLADARRQDERDHRVPAR